MAFCIECGAQIPEKAKFCPQCGTAQPVIETQTDPVIETQTSPSIKGSDAGSSENVDASVSEDNNQDIDVQDIDEASVNEELSTASVAEDLKAEPVENTSDDDAPSIENSIAAMANAEIQPGKSKTGLWVGLGLITLLIAGGGAYALGLIPTTKSDPKIVNTAPVIETPAPEQEAKVETAPADQKSSTLEAYQAAIKSGRISDLGKFAQDHPESSLAKDAQNAAFESLKRQSSPLAFNTFIEYFPEADLTRYSGPRTGDDVLSSDAGIVSASTETLSAPLTSETPVTIELDIPAIRTSITTRVEGLEPFIAQGDGAYAVSVVDELLALPDLSEAEATYLLNTRARAETAGGFTVDTSTPDVAESDVPTESFTSPVINAEPAPEIEIEPDAAPIIIEPETPPPAFDVAAKPIERFGAITPDEATEPGECDMTFSIDSTGTPINVNAVCTQAIFAPPAIETVAEWLYSPATLNGTPVQQDGLQVKLKFHLEDTE